MDDLRKVFLSALWAKLADQPAPSPHTNCNKVIATRLGTIYSTLATRIEADMTEAIQTHRTSLTRKAYDQAHIDVELQYPSIVQDILNETHNMILQTERDQVQAITGEVCNLVHAEFDQWKHNELSIQQADALACLAHWEQDCHEEQLNDFRRTWDSYPLHALRSTLDDWLATHGLHIAMTPVATAPPDPMASSLDRMDTTTHVSPDNIMTIMAPRSHSLESTDLTGPHGHDIGPMLPGQAGTAR